MVGKRSRGRGMRHAPAEEVYCHKKRCSYRRGFNHNERLAARRKKAGHRPTHPEVPAPARLIQTIVSPKHFGPDNESRSTEYAKSLCLLCCRASSRIEASVLASVRTRSGFCPMLFNTEPISASAATSRRSMNQRRYSAGIKDEHQPSWTPMKATQSTPFQVTPHVGTLHRLRTERDVVLLYHDGAHVEGTPAYLGASPFKPPRPCAPR